MANYKTKPFRVLIFVLTILYCLSFTSVFASAEGSLYISAYGAYMSTGSSGNVLVTFQITGTGMMDEIGTTYIFLYENSSLIKTYTNTTTSGMLAYNKPAYANSITYSGTVGKTYSALVVFKSGVGGGYDNRSMDTNSVVAKN